MGTSSSSCPVRVLKRRRGIGPGSSCSLIKTGEIGGFSACSIVARQGSGIGDQGSEASRPGEQRPVAAPHPEGTRRPGGPRYPARARQGWSSKKVVLQVHSFADPQGGKQQLRISF